MEANVGAEKSTEARLEGKGLTLGQSCWGGELGGRK